MLIGTPRGCKRGKELPRYTDSTLTTLNIKMIIFLSVLSRISSTNSLYMGHKEPVLRPRYTGAGRARTHILFYSILLTVGV